MPSSNGADGDRIQPSVVEKLDQKLAEKQPSAAHEEVFNQKDNIKGRFPDGEVGISGMHKSLGDMKKLFETPDATPQEIAQAGKKLDDSIGPAAPKETQQELKNIQAGVLSGDTAKVGEAIKDIQEKHPEMLKGTVQELNREFKENNAGVEMSVTADGKVLLYKNDPLDLSGNKSALQIDPKDGSVGARPIKVRDDGTAVLEPGEIVNADVDKIAKSIGNTATSRVNGKSIKVLDEKPVQEPGALSDLPIGQHKGHQNFQPAPFLPEEKSHPLPFRPEGTNEAFINFINKDYANKAHIIRDGNTYRVDDEKSGSSSAKTVPEGKGEPKD